MIYNGTSSTVIWEKKYIMFIHYKKIIVVNIGRTISKINFRCQWFIFSFRNKHVELEFQKNIFRVFRIYYLQMKEWLWNLKKKWFVENVFKQKHVATWLDVMWGRGELLVKMWNLFKWWWIMVGILINQITGELYILQ